MASLFLAVGALVGLRLLRAQGVLSPPDPASGGISEFADLLAVVTALVGLLVPPFVRLGWRLVRRALPRPGSEAFALEDLPGLRRAFEVDRAAITAAMVPSHVPAALPALSARRVDFGDAALTVDVEARKELADFVGQPRHQSSRMAPEDKREREILLVTGEPGAGKSVLFQELHASLSFGVEAGNHSLLPLVLFARDLNVATLKRAARSTAPLQAILADSYQHRISASSANEELKALLGLIVRQWEQLDCLVLIDGLDEIAQRSTYEVIQRQLAAFIQSDLATISGRCVHRYLLSCRVDENLELFPGAANLFLRGLSDRQRERFCQALIGRQGFDRRARLAMEETLSSRVSPTHVFRRNPYFLSLLVRHMREDEDRVRDQTLDFDFLMRKYLEREAVRPHAGIGEKADLNVEERRGLFDELERISRPVLQFLAFRSAASASARALYDEAPIDAGLLSELAHTLHGSGEQEAGLWATLRRLASGAADGGELTASDLDRLGLLRDLHENDIRLLLSQVARARRGGLNAEVILGAFGGLPYRRILEPQLWYVDLANRLADLHPGATDTLTCFAALLFARSVGAAHVLRVLYVELRPGSTTLRFRHRRLAEYYAACYLRDRWPTLVGGLRLSPWLGPVFNLTCALEGPPCHTLQWLVQEVQKSPREPAFSWRYAVEAAVEASFFAHPGPAYRETVKTLSEEVLSHLGSSDAVTEMVILRAPVLLAELSEVLGGEALLTESSVQRFFAYEASRSAEWTAPILPARLAIQTLAKRRPSLSNRVRWWIRLIQQPSAVFSENIQAPRSGLLAIRLTVLASVFLSELLCALVLAFLVVGPFSLLAHQLGVDKEVLFPAAKGLFFFILGSLGVLRALAWQRSPTKAAERGALLWRFPTLIRQGLGRLYRGRSELVRTLLSSVADRLAMLVFVVLLLSGISLLALPLVRSKGELRSCPEIAQIWEQIATQFPTHLNAPDMDLQRLRRELRSSLDRLREANREKHCGGEQRGVWVLAEDRMADYLAELDPRLVPSPPDDHSPLLSLSDVQTLEEILAAQPVSEPPPGFIGSLAAFQLSWQEGAAVERLMEMEARLLDERRAGYGLPAVGDEAAAEPDVPEAIARATTALGKIDVSLATHGAALESLKATFQPEPFFGSHWWGRLRRTAPPAPCCVCPGPRPADHGESRSHCCRPRAVLSRTLGPEQRENPASGLTEDRPAGICRSSGSQAAGTDRGQPAEEHGWYGA